MWYILILIFFTFTGKHIGKILQSLKVSVEEVSILIEFLYHVFAGVSVYLSLLRLSKTASLVNSIELSIWTCTSAFCKHELWILVMINSQPYCTFFVINIIILLSILPLPCSCQYNKQDDRWGTTRYIISSPKSRKYCRSSRWSQFFLLLWIPWDRPYTWPGAWAWAWRIYVIATWCTYRWLT